MIAGCAVVIGLTATPAGQDRRTYLAFSTLVAATFAGATHGDAQWLPTWILVGNAVPVVLRGRWLAVGGAVIVGASAWAGWRVTPHEGSRAWSEAFVVLLAVLANTAFTRLLETVAELRRTRAELARVAVAEERERFSRDLHDLLGHTLSVMVVKAQAVRRLVATDPDAAAEHAADIERVGRTALLDVRQAVDAMRAPNLPEELLGARDALEAAGIRATIDAGRRGPAGGRRRRAGLGAARGHHQRAAALRGRQLLHRGEPARRPHRARRRRQRRGHPDPTGRRIARAGGWPGRSSRPVARGRRPGGGLVHRHGFRLVASIPSRLGARP